MVLFSDMWTDFSIYREKKGRYNVIRDERRGLTWPYAPHGRAQPGRATSAPSGTRHAQPTSPYLHTTSRRLPCIAAGWTTDAQDRPRDRKAFSSAESAAGLQSDLVRMRSAHRISLGYRRWTESESDLPGAGLLCRAG